jgi:hypothetical protein
MVAVDLVEIPIVILGDVPTTSMKPAECREEAPPALVELDVFLQKSAIDGISNERRHRDAAAFGGAAEPSTLIVGKGDEQSSHARMISAAQPMM